MNIIFTPASLLEILDQIDELKDYNIGVTETFDNKIQIQIGDSIYQVETEGTEEVEVPQETIDKVEEVNEDAYENLVDGADFEEINEEVVEGGIIKEAIKSLLLGGAIKLIKKLL